MGRFIVFISDEVIFLLSYISKGVKIYKTNCDSYKNGCD